MRLAPENLEFKGVLIDTSTAVPRRTGVRGFKSRLKTGTDPSDVSDSFGGDAGSVGRVSLSVPSFSDGVALPGVVGGEVDGKPSICPEVIIILHSFE